MGNNLFFLSLFLCTALMTARASSLWPFSGLFSAKLEQMVRAKASFPLWGPPSGLYWLKKARDRGRRGLLHFIAEYGDEEKGKWLFLTAFGGQ